MKYDIPISERGEGLSEKFGKFPKDSEKNGDFSENAERFDEPNKAFPKSSETGADFSEDFRNIPKSSENEEHLSEKVTPVSERFEKQNLKRANHITSLRVYELSKLIFSNHNFQFKPENKIEERLIDLSFQTLEGIGSGFYDQRSEEK